MKDYLFTIIIISLIKGICDILSPNFKSLHKYTKAIGVLCVLCVVITPLINVVDEINDGFFDDIKDQIVNEENSGQNAEMNEILNGYLNEYSIGLLKDEIYTRLENEFSIPRSDCSITVHTSVAEGKITVSDTVILLSGKSIFKNPYDIEEYFSTLLNCNCKVLLK